MDYRSSVVAENGWPWRWWHYWWYVHLISIDGRLEEAGCSKLEYRWNSFRPIVMLLVV